MSSINAFVSSTNSTESQEFSSATPKSSLFSSTIAAIKAFIQTIQTKGILGGLFAAVRAASEAYDTEEARKKALRESVSGCDSLPSEGQEISEVVTKIFENVVGGTLGAPKEPVAKAAGASVVSTPSIEEIFRDSDPAVLDAFFREENEPPVAAVLRQSSTNDFDPLVLDEFFESEPPAPATVAANNSSNSGGKTTTRNQGPKLMCDRPGAIVRTSTITVERGHFSEAFQLSLLHTRVSGAEIVGSPVAVTQIFLPEDSALSTVLGGFLPNNLEGLGTVVALHGGGALSTEEWPEYLALLSPEELELLALERQRSTENRIEELEDEGEDFAHVLEEFDALKPLQDLRTKQLEATLRQSESHLKKLEKALTQLEQEGACEGVSALGEASERTEESSVAVSTSEVSKSGSFARTIKYGALTAMVLTVAYRLTKDNSEALQGQLAKILTSGQLKTLVTLGSQIDGQVVLGSEVAIKAGQAILDQLRLSKEQMSAFAQPAVGALKHLTAQAGAIASQYGLKFENRGVIVISDAVSAEGFVNGLNSGKEQALQLARHYGSVAKEMISTTSISQTGTALYARTRLHRSAISHVGLSVRNTALNAGGSVNSAVRDASPTTLAMMGLLPVLGIAQFVFNRLYPKRVPGFGMLRRSIGENSSVNQALREKAKVTPNLDPTGIKMIQGLTDLDNLIEDFSIAMGRTFNYREEALNEISGVVKQESPNFSIQSDE